jgi:MFS family permease
VGLLGLGTAALFTVATILTTNKTATLFFLGLVLAGITAQQTVIVTVVVDIAEKYVGGILGLTNTIANIGGFLFSVSFGYFVTLFASYDLALLPMAILLTIGALSWLRIDATQQLIRQSRQQPRQTRVRLPWVDPNHPRLILSTRSCNELTAAGQGLASQIPFQLPPDRVTKLHDLQACSDLPHSGLTFIRNRRR